MSAAWRKRRGPVRLAILGGSILALVLVSTGILAVFFPSKALAAQSTLTILGGLVEVRQSGGVYVQAADGQIIEGGVSLRTAADGNAVLTYFDGSTVTLEPGTELEVEELTSKGADVVIVMRQVVGSTWHVVARALTPGSKYELRTPAGTASVRGTAFTTMVSAAGEFEIETVEGTVAATPPAVAGAPALAPVLVGAGQVTTSTLSTPPTAARAAPEPPATVRIALDAGASTTAVAVDASGRSVGIQNGSAVRYAPGSTVEVVDGRLVLSIPQRQPGRISTIVRPPDAAPGAPPVTVNIQTQVISGGNVVANTFEQRAVDDSGSARGGIVTTSAGVIVLPDAAAREMGAPNLGKAPPPPPTGQFQFFAPAPPTQPQLLPAFQPGNAPQGGPGGATPVFFGGFQGFQVLAAAPTGGGIAQFSGPGVTPPTGGVAAGAAPGFVQFTGALPAGFVPPPPQSNASGCGAFSGRDCVQPPAGGPGFPGGATPPGAPGFPGGATPPGAPGFPGVAPLPGAAPSPFVAPAGFDPSSFLPPGFTFPTTQGPNPFANFRPDTTAPGGAPPPGAPGFPGGESTLPAGCTAGIFGISCSGVAAPPQFTPGGVPGVFPPGTAPTACPPGTTGLFPTCVPTGTAPTAPGVFPPGTAPTACPPGTTGLFPTCVPTTTAPAPGTSPTTCPPGTTGLFPTCVPTTTAPAPGTACPPGTTGLFPTCVPTTAPIAPILAPAPTIAPILAPLPTATPP